MSIAATAAMRQLPMRSSQARWPVGKWYFNTKPGSDVSGGSTVVTLTFPVGIFNVGFVGVKCYNTSIGPGQATLTINEGLSTEIIVATMLKIPNGTIAIPIVLHGNIRGGPFLVTTSAKIELEIQNLTAGVSPVFFAGGYVWDLAADRAIGGPAFPGTEIITIGYDVDID